MPSSVTLTSTAPLALPDGDGDAGAVRAVVHGVLDEVAQRGGQLRLAAADGQPALAPAHQRDAGRRRDGAGAVRRPSADDAFDLHQLLLGQRVGRLCSQLDR
jgi:hypothetical protein